MECIYTFINYYGIHQCKNVDNLLKLENTNSDTDMIWYLKNGTVVKSESKDMIYDIINCQLRNTSTYWATEIVNNLWEVQFDSRCDPTVKVIFNSTSYGKDIAKIAIECMKKDCAGLEIIDSNVYTID